MDATTFLKIYGFLPTQCARKLAPMRSADARQIGGRTADSQDRLPALGSGRKIEGRKTGAIANTF